MDASFEKRLRRSPADSLRDENIMPLARSLDLHEIDTTFALNFFKTSTAQRVVRLRRALEAQFVFDLGETLHQITPREGIRLRTQCGIEEQVTQSSRIFESLCALDIYPLRDATIAGRLRSVFAAFRLGALPRSEAQGLLSPDMLTNGRRYEAAQGWLEDVVEGHLPAERTRVGSLYTSCALSDSFGNQIEFLDQEDGYHRRTAFAAEVETSYEYLAGRLGEPNYEPFPGEPTSTEWIFQYRGHVFTVYDYKTSNECGEGALPVSKIRSAFVMPWHIGAHRGVDPALLSEVL